MQVRNWISSNFQTTRGLIWLHFKQNSKAEDAFIQSIAASPTAAAYCGLGIAFLRLNNYESALYSFCEAAELDPRSSYNYRWLRWAEHLHSHQTSKQQDCYHCDNGNEEAPNTEITTMTRKMLLVAAMPEGQYLAKRALAAAYDLRFASTLREAKQLLRESESAGPPPGSTFDMVICDILFDDSRMFDLLQCVRTEDHFEKLPFLVIQHSASVASTDGTKTTSELLGAYDLIELQDLPADKAQKLFVQTVERSFERTVERERTDTKPHKD